MANRVGLVAFRTLVGLLALVAPLLAGLLACTRAREAPGAAILLGVVMLVWVLLLLGLVLETIRLSVWTRFVLLCIAWPVTAGTLLFAAVQIHLLFVLALGASFLGIDLALRNLSCSRCGYTMCNPVSDSGVARWS
ncbi:MAG TPA: hypothetical protein VLD61_08305 [Methylomirabilota bacterium]|nr:hypothetical protein [Methylomirabilota bacterium]